MRQNIILRFLLFSLSIVSFSLFVVSCNRTPDNGLVIITEAPANLQQANFVNGKAWRYVEQARIAVFNPTHPSQKPEVLTGKFYSACAPEISFDGTHMIFAGQQTQDKPWEIWEMDLKNKECRQVTSYAENCIDPVYLPGNMILFSKTPQKDTVGAAQALFFGNLDGTGINQVTYHPVADFAPNVLNDGRILAISRQVYPRPGEPMLYVLRPDGTKGETYYLGAQGSKPMSRAWESQEGIIYFVESSAEGSDAGSLICLNQNNPAHTRVNLTAALQGDFRTVFPEPGGKLLVTYRSTSADKFGVYEFDPVTKTLNKPLYTDPDYQIIDAIGKINRKVPRKLPSEVVAQGVKTGLIMCQDINFNGLPKPAGDKPLSKATQVEVEGIDVSLGTLSAEKDGSFYLKVIANMPFRFVPLDANGKHVGRPSAWFWLRPNERRGLVGLHNTFDFAPDNRVPMAVKKDPVIIPIHITKIDELEVDLEE